MAPTAQATSSVIAAKKTAPATTTSPRSPFELALQCPQTPPSPCPPPLLTASPTCFLPGAARESQQQGAASVLPQATLEQVVLTEQAPQTAATLNLLIGLQAARAQLEAHMTHSGLPALVNATNGALRGVQAGAASLAAYLQHFGRAPITPVSAGPGQGTGGLQPSVVQSGPPDVPAAMEVRASSISKGTSAPASSSRPITHIESSPWQAEKGLAMGSTAPSGPMPLGDDCFMISHCDEGKDHQELLPEDDDSKWVASLTAPDDSSLCELIDSLQVAADLPPLPTLRTPGGSPRPPSLKTQSTCPLRSPGGKERGTRSAPTTPSNLQKLAIPPPSPRTPGVLSQTTPTYKRLRGKDLPPLSSPRKRRNWSALLEEEQAGSKQRMYKAAEASRSVKVSLPAVKLQMGILDFDEYEQTLIQEEETGNDQSNPVLRHLREIAELLPSDGSLDTEAVLAQATLYIRTLQRTTSAEGAAARAKNVSA